MKIHVLHKRAKTHGAPYDGSCRTVPLLAPGPKTKKAKDRQYPFGYVLFDSTEADRTEVQLAVAVLLEIEDPDDLLWIEVTQRHLPI